METTIATLSVPPTNNNPANESLLKTFTIKNTKGTSLLVCNYGAAVISIFVKDRAGNFSDVVLGYENPRDYLTDDYYIGTVVGRYANRIMGDNIIIDNHPYLISTRPGGYHQHGGFAGFNKKYFDATPFSEKGKTGVSLKYTSQHLEEGFPGKLELEVIYTLDEEDNWTVEYKAVSDKTTLINLTQHTYFNLSGKLSGSIDDHELQITANSYLPVNKLQVPTGVLATVIDTPFDFTEFKKIDKDLFEEDEQLKLSNGYDHSFVLETEKTGALKPAAIVQENTSGRKLEVFTTEPAVHLYTGNFLENIIGKNGIVYNQRSGLCLETQHFPDAPNHADFPSTVLKAGELFYSKTVFRFSVEI
ncbi:galactose mutarotase [soil metagenome]